MSNFPYPTFVEIIRSCAKVLGVKAGNKQLDDKAKDKTVDYRLFNELINEILVHVSKSFGSRFSTTLKFHMEKLLEEYSHLVSSEYADGILRSEMKEILSKTLFKTHVVDIFENVFNSLSGSKPSISTYFSFHTTCTAQLISWLEENESGWMCFYNGLNKENKAKIKAWKDGEHTPDIHSLVLLNSWSTGPWPERIDWHKIRILLYLASVIDRVANEDGASLFLEECRLLNWGATQLYSYNQLIKSLQQRYKERIAKMLPLIGEIQQGLRRTVPKYPGQVTHFSSAIEKLEQYLDCDEHKSHFDYWVTWHKARLHVLNGEIDNAHNLYKVAFEECLFRGGINQKKVIEEAIVVAASLNKPDKVFLKQLKNALITFKYEIPSVQKNESSNKFSDIVEDWEVQNWKASFKLVFPKSGMFPESDELDIKGNIGPIIVSDPEKYKPDFRNPNRKFKVGDHRYKTFPQLVWFAYIEKFDVVRRLLELGADVNLLSSSGDSALLMSLEALNIKSVDSSLDDSLFNLLSNYNHKLTTLNHKTDKKKLLPLICAVEAGRVDVVEKLLQMGADVNTRGATDSQTVLNVCIKMIGVAKDSDLFWEKQANMKLTPEVLDSIRRHNPGLTGFSLEHQLEHITRQASDPRYQRSLKLVTEIMSENTGSQIDLNVMREIAILLIDAGADVNAEHTSPVKGYTALMLVAELDEAKLLNKMLSHNGDPRKTYYCQNTAMDVDCWRIAEYFKSHEVLTVLKDIERFFPKPPDFSQLH